MFGMSFPGFTCCESTIHCARSALVFGTAIAPSVVREARCVRSGPTSALALVPRIVWQLEQAPARNAASPALARAVGGLAAGLAWAASQRRYTAGGSAKT